MKPTTSITNILQQLPDAPVLTTRERDRWKGVTVDFHEYTPNYSVATPAHDHYLVCYVTAGKGKLTQKRDGRIHEGTLCAGMTIIMPVGYDSVWEGEAAASARLRVPHELVSKAVDEIGESTNASYEIINVFQTWDATIGHLANLFLGEMDRPVHPAQALISDTISSALAGHLLRSYNAFDIQEHPISGLAPHVLSRVVAYIEEHTENTIRLDELANIAGVSRFHFSRLFKASTNTSPMAYVEQSRIRKAQSLILKGEISLAEIALMVGFADQSHFTRRFQLYTGCTPAVFARSKGIKLVRAS